MEKSSILYYEIKHLYITGKWYSCEKTTIYDPVVLFVMYLCMDVCICCCLCYDKFSCFFLTQLNFWDYEEDKHKFKIDSLLLVGEFGSLTEILKINLREQRRRRRSEKKKRKEKKEWHE